MVLSAVTAYVLMASSSLSSAATPLQSPSRLVSLFLLHRGLSCHDENASDAENYEKVLFYHPGKCPDRSLLQLAPCRHHFLIMVSDPFCVLSAKTPISQQLQQVGFCEGLMDFVGRFGDDDEEGEEGIETMRLKVR